MEENEKGTVQIRMKEKKQNKTVWEGIKRLKKKEFNNSDHVFGKRELY